MQKYKRRTYLINKKFQLRFSFYVCSWLFGLSLVYPFIIYGVFDMFMRYAALDPMGPPVESLKEIRSDLIWMLVGLQALFLVITFVISIFVSHRIAGPLFKLRKSFHEAENGNLDQQIVFRKYDYFPELAESFNRMLSGIRSDGKATGKTQAESKTS